MKIGEEIRVSEPSQLKTILGEKTFNIKEGDKYLVTKSGIRYLTGEARGKMVFINNKNEVSYDVDNIAKRIATKLANDLGQSYFYDYLEDIDLTLDDVTNFIMEELEEYI